MAVAEGTAGASGDGAAAAFVHAAAVRGDGAQARRAVRARARTTRCCGRPPCTKRVRVRRADTHHARGWPWPGRRRTRFPPRAFRRLIAAVWPDEGSGGGDSALVARVARLGFVVLSALSKMLRRSLAPSEEELVVEYGITDPNGADKFYVDPLRDWEPARVTYYHDSFGRPVYLSANAPNGMAIALEFCDAFEEEDGHWRALEPGVDAGEGGAAEGSVDGERPQVDPPPPAGAGTAGAA